MRRYHLPLFADHYQFCLEDEAADPPEDDMWDEEASDRLVAVETGRVWIGTCRESVVPIAIEVHDRQPQAEMGKYEHIVECGLVMRGCHLIVAGCTEDLASAARIPLPVGVYRLRISFANISATPGSACPGPEAYEVQIWPAAYCETRILSRQAPNVHSPPLSRTIN